MLATQEDLKNAVEDVVWDVMVEADLKNPPIDSIEVAEMLGLRTTIDRNMQARGTRRIVGGQTCIFLGGLSRNEQFQFTTAHELGEELAAGILEQAGEQPAGLDPAAIEQVADLFASYLLCPNPWFESDARSLDFDVPALKDIYATASHQVIAWRLLLLPEAPSAITIFDNGKIHSRRANCNCDRGLLAIEQHAWIRCHESGTQVDTESDGYRVQCWPIWEGDWKREIMRTSVSEW